MIMVAYQGARNNAIYQHKCDKTHPFRDTMNCIRNSLHHYTHRLLTTLGLSYLRNDPAVENTILESRMNTGESTANSLLDTEFNGMGICQHPAHPNDVIVAKTSPNG
jgi:hypothetical protein